LTGVRFSHVIATKGRPEPLRDALESSVAALPEGGEIIVVDGDPKRSAEAVVQQIADSRGHSPIRYIVGVSGLCAQRNAGVAAAQGDIVVFTDDDCTLVAGFYEALAPAYEDPTVVGATGRVLEPRDDRIGSDVESSLRRLVLGGGRQGTMTSFGFRRPIVDVEQPHSVEYMPGAFMSARRTHAAEVRFDEQLERLSGYALGEDDDFSYRLSRLGRIRYMPSAAVNHQALGKRTMDRRALDRLVVINRTYLYRKNFAGTLRGKLGFVALFALIFAHRIVNREWRGIRGLIDGFHEAWRMRADARAVNSI
jgi:GT2 family glycosyltransferase